MGIFSTLAQEPKSQQKLVRVAVLILTMGLAVMISLLFLAPRGKKKLAEYKFMHCKQCKWEQPFKEQLLKSPCTYCPKKDGELVPTVESMRGKGGSLAAENSLNPWKWFNISLLIESVLFLGGLVYILRAREKEAAVKHLYCNCPHCKWRLRFRESLVGKGGQCPRCKRLFKFPEGEEAEKEEFPQEQEEHTEV